MERNGISSKYLTIRYTFHQICFYIMNAGIFAFAATYLQEKGFLTSQVGVVLAASSILSCVVQPILGDMADRLKSFALPKMIAALSLCSLACFLCIQLLNPRTEVFGFLYMIGGLAVSATASLNNSICAYYSKRNYPINFGLGLGVGCLAYSVASLGLGFILARFGVDRMIWIVAVSLIFQMLIVLGYPKINTGYESLTEADREHEQGVSLVKFWKKYKIFSFSIVGVVMIAMCHAMTENYLINIFNRMGGSSANVGTALFIACIAAAPLLFTIEKVQSKIDYKIMMRLSGICYMLKTFIIIQATTVSGVYIAELLQFCTYGFIYPCLYYYVKDRILDADMAKGQAAAMASYILGTAFGSYVGGSLIGTFGMEQMLVAALMFAGAGAVVINLTVGKRYVG